MYELYIDFQIFNLYVHAVAVSQIDNGTIYRTLDQSS